MDDTAVDARPTLSNAAPAGAAAESPRVVIAAARDAAGAGTAATLAVVVDTEGSTYVEVGAAALFAGEASVGWLSGGCLEPEIARHAAEAAATSSLGWLDIDTRDDDDLLAGSTAGCRGRLRIALLPLHTLPGVVDVFAAWLAGGRALALRIGVDGRVEMLLDGRGDSPRRAATDGAARRSTGDEARIGGWTLPVRPAQAPDGVRLALWAPSPELMLLGAGPETSSLLPMLRALGWRTTLVERRARWRGLAALADAHRDATPAAALATGPWPDAALVMHHAFELDREALAALADAPVPYVGLLGPVRRREDLFRVIPAAARGALAPRLRSPVGLHLGGRGAAAIALSVVAELQAWRHGLEPRR